MLAGAGPVATETRTVDSFDQVEADGGVRVQLTVGGPTSVQVTAQQNLLPITTTVVANGKLTVRTTQSFSSSSGITVAVSTPTIKSISVNGGAATTAEGVSATDLDIAADGGGVLSIAGTADSLTLRANGGAVVDGSNFVATNASVDLGGGASATVGVTSSATGSAGGGSTLNLLGNPPSVSVTASGGASVKH